MVAAIALWFHLRLPSCGHRFESQAHHLCFFKFVLLKLYRENNENKQKEAGIGPFFLKNVLRCGEPLATTKMFGLQGPIQNVKIKRSDFNDMTFYFSISFFP